MNFTLDLDVEQYCEATEQDLTKVQVREQVQEQCIASIVRQLMKKGVDVELLGRNNVYDAIQRLTVAEHLVTSQ
jgi:ethanolamine ammonia-lyase small subunit